MTRRRNRCFTYGEERRTRVPLLDERGMVVGGITLAQYVTACGRLVDDADLDLTVPDIQPKRPPGICVRCWANWRNECLK